MFKILMDFIGAPSDGIPMSYSHTSLFRNTDRKIVGMEVRLLRDPRNSMKPQRAWVPDKDVQLDEGLQLACGWDENFYSLLMENAMFLRKT